MNISEAPILKLEFYENTDNAIFVHIWDSAVSSWQKNIKWSDFVECNNYKKYIRDFYGALVSGYSEYLTHIWSDIGVITNATEEVIHKILRKFVAAYLSEDSIHNTDCGEADVIFYTYGKVEINIDSGPCNRICPYIHKIEKYVREIKAV